MDELIRVALIGTAHAAPLDIADRADHDEPCTTALKAVRRGVAEDDLLAAASILSAYESCGRPADAAPPAAFTPAPPDKRPACSPRAGALLEQILAQPNAASRQSLLAEWLAAAASANCRAPHDLLPPLLEYGASNRSVRDAISLVIDERGGWLMSLNRRWQFAAPDAADATTIWSTGNREQRSAALRRLREKDPTAARDLVGSTWKEDAADERASFVETFAVALSAQDEAFLEAALDDRSKQVRAAAAAVLGRLAASAFVQRMRTRGESMLRHRPAEKGGIFRGGKPAAIEIELPPDAFDPAWSRDGIEEKPPGRLGRRQWWATQILSTVPPAVWSTQWQLPPDACVEAAAGDFRSLLLDAWAAAAERHGDSAWVQAVLMESIDAKPVGDGKASPRLSLLKLLPRDAQPGVLAALLSAADLDVLALQQILQSVEIQFDPTTATAALDAVRRTLRKAGDAFHYGLAGVLEALVHRIPPGITYGLAKDWTGPAWEANRRALDPFFLTLQLRRDIETEFK